MSELVTRADLGRVSVLTLNNPPANGYSHAMHRELDAHVIDLRMDAGTDVIVLRGAGERFFCAGADINYLQSLDPDAKYAFCLHANETLLRLENTPKLVIAAINGHCVGGGLEIALACDLRIGRASVGKPNLVGLPEVSLGVLPGTGGTQRLTRILGRARALEWMVEGRNVSVEDARVAGLVHQVLPAEGWWDAVLAYATSFTRPGKAAQAVGLIKRAVIGGADLPLEAGLALERELQMRLFAAPDAKEGLAAFLEKRPARFTGSPVTQTSPAPEPTPAARPLEPRPAAPAVAARPSAAPESSRRSEPVIATERFYRPAHEPEAPDEAEARSELTALPAPPPARTVDAPGSTLARLPPTPRRGPSPDEPGAPPGFEGFQDFADFGAEDEDGGGDPFGTGQSTPAEPAPAGLIDLHRTRIPDAVLNLLGRTLVEQHRVLPVKRTETTLLVAMADPTDTEALDAIREETGLLVQAIRAPELDIATMVARYYRA